jgi:undecaprenyl-diphosphatase
MFTACCASVRSGANVVKAIARVKTACLLVIGSGTVGGKDVCRRTFPVVLQLSPNHLVALWEGGESRLGNTAWRGIDSEIIGAVSAEALKHVFTRVRPSETDDPGLWFQGESNHSFPSGEAATAAAIVTPYILEYGKDHPSVYALTLVPLYVGIGRVKAQAHWQTDVLAGWAIGGLSGWYAHARDTPIVLQVMPHGIFVGLKKTF